VQSNPLLYRSVDAVLQSGEPAGVSDMFGFLRRLDLRCILLPSRDRCRPCGPPGSSSSAACAGYSVAEPVALIRDVTWRAQEVAIFQQLIASN
jgi:hypothetical protein